ncbi:MAG: outer membrane beta-barrel protein [Bacteroidales bacterium]|nr:outer membrane beta-barrel protein [Bacteroidales bacterium]
MRRFLFLAFILVNATNVPAQFSAGIRIGLSFPDFYERKSSVLKDLEVHTEGRAAFEPGLFIHYKITDRIDLVNEFSLRPKNGTFLFKYNESGQIIQKRGDYRLDYLTWLLLSEFTPGNISGWHINLGTFVGILALSHVNGSKEILSPAGIYYNIELDCSAREDFRGPDYGLILGAGYHDLSVLKQNLLMDLRVGWGLPDISKHGGDLFLLNAVQFSIHAGVILYRSTKRPATLPVKL